QNHASQDRSWNGEMERSHGIASFLRMIRAARFYSRAISPSVPMPATMHNSRRIRGGALDATVVFDPRSPLHLAAVSLLWPRRRVSAAEHRAADAGRELGGFSRSWRAG